MYISMWTWSLRAADRGEHRVVGGRAVLEQDHAVADAERGAGDRLLDGEVAVEEIGFRRARLEVLDDGLALRAVMGPRELSICTGTLRAWSM